MWARLENSNRNSSIASITAAVVGLVCGLMEMVIARGHFFTEALYRRLPVGDLETCSPRAWNTLP